MGLWKKPTGPQRWSLYRRGWALWWDLGGRGVGGVDTELLSTSGPAHFTICTYLRRPVNPFPPGTTGSEFSLRQV